MEYSGAKIDAISQVVIQHLYDVGEAPASQLEQIADVENREQIHYRFREHLIPSGLAERAGEISQQGAVQDAVIYRLTGKGQKWAAKQYDEIAIATDPESQLREMEDLTDEVDRICREYSNLEDQVTEFDRRISDFEEIIRDFRNEVRDEVDEAIGNGDDAWRKAQRSMEKVHDMEQDLETMRREIDRFEERIDEFESLLEQHRNERERLHYRLNEIEEWLSSEIPAIKDDALVARERAEEPPLWKALWPF